MKYREALVLLVVIIAAVAFACVGRVIRPAVVSAPPAVAIAPQTVAGVSVGMNQAQVVAIVGQPDMKSPDASTWSYWNGNRNDPRLLVSFDASGHVVAVRGPVTTPRGIVAAR